MRQLSAVLGVVLTAILLVSPAAALSFNDFIPGSSSSETHVLNQSVGEQLDFSTSGTTITEKSGFFGSFFSIVTSDDTVMPTDPATFETTLNINNWNTVCDSYYYSGDIQIDIWLEGPGVTKSDTKDVVIMSCSGDGTKDVAIDFQLPAETGDLTYDFKVGTTYETTYGTQTWEKTVETDSIEVTLPELTANLDGDSEIMAGDEADFDATASTGYRGIDQYKWFVDGTRIGGDTRTFEHEFNQPGTHTVRVEVTDYTWDLFDTRRWDSDSITIRVIGDDDGDGIPNPEDDCENTPGEEEFDGCPDPDPDDDGVKNANDDCPDQAGELDNGCPNTEPQVASFDTKSKVFAGESFTASVTASDPDGHRLTYTWSNGATSPETDFTFKSTGTKEVSVEISDGYTTVSRSQQVEVVAQPTDNTTDTEPVPGNESGGSGDSSDGTGTGTGTGTGRDDGQDRGVLGNLFYGFVDFLGGVL